MYIWFIYIYIIYLIIYHDIILILYLIIRRQIIFKYIDNFMHILCMSTVFTLSMPSGVI